MHVCVFRGHAFCMSKSGGRTSYKAPLCPYIFILPTAPTRSAFDFIAMYDRAPWK